MKTECLTEAAAILGRKGGRAGRGKAKRRSREHYQRAAAKSAEVRRAKRAVALGHT